MSTTPPEQGSQPAPGGSVPSGGAAGAQPAAAVNGSVPPDAVAAATDTMHQVQLDNAKNPKIPEPGRRRLRVYAYDPSLEAELKTLNINEALLDLRWERLEPGPVGEYIEVVDVDPASDACYAPANLDHPHLLVSNGYAPSEANARFHQQMVYAVAMKTIEHFELALGRKALWSDHWDSQAKPPAQYVQRLRIYPHALREENAYYSPDKKALLLGYFPARAQDSRVDPSGTLVFSCLSYDIVAHETTHALLDGLHRRYREVSDDNPDMAAFHEAFADIVALFQHFTIPEALHDQIAKTRGDLREQSLLSGLAVQFGDATGQRGALRDFIGRYDPNEQKWKRVEPKRTDYADNKNEPHALGAVLVAAVFDAFLQVYAMRSEDLIRLSTNGTGVLPEGAIPALLIDQLSAEASRIAAQFLQICIRALDYCPPIELTYGDYLRALITADRDVLPDDDRSYRVAIVSAFRNRGIAAEGVRHLSPGSLSWEAPPEPPPTLPKLGELITKLKPKLSWDLNADRSTAWRTSNENAAQFHDWLLSDDVHDTEVAMLGLHRWKPNDDHQQDTPMTIAGVAGRLRRIEVHSVRPATRVTYDGQTRSDLVVEITQGFVPDDGSNIVRAGVTLLIDLQTNKIRYLIRKRLERALERRKDMAAAADGTAFALNTRVASLRANYFDNGGPVRSREPFAMMHRTIGPRSN
jgi:hypothetical protein